MIPANENGIVLDNYLFDDLRIALAPPFNFSDAFLYSHGWWTDATRAMQDYNRFTIGFAQLAGDIAIANPAALGAGSLGIGIHWPSMLTENSGSILSLLEAATFYTMEKRADNIGENAGYTVLRSLLQSPAPPRRINLVGHSFGCKVILSSLQAVAQDGIQVPPNVALNVILLQAATDDNHLEHGDAYGLVSSALPGLRMLVTVSQEDLALKVAYPAAHLANLFRGKGDRRALGGAGPTDLVVQQFGGKASISVDWGFNRQAITAVAASRLVVADLTGIHRDPRNSYKADPLCGHHSDIFRPEIYELMAGFIFGI
jgi:hypothetical protein